MKLNFNKEYFKENFQKTVVFIGLFILIILSIKSGSNVVSQQNVSTTILPENNNKIENTVTNTNPYRLAYEKCTHPKMSEYYQNKCIALELKNNGVK